MPRKRTSQTQSSSEQLDSKSKQIKKPKGSQSRAKKSRVKRQLAFDEGTKTEQHKDNAEKSEVAKSEVVEVKDGSKFTPSQFKFEHILSENPTTKSVAVYGKFPADSKDNFAVILAEKMAFTHETIKTLFTESTTFTHKFQNDIYGQYMCDADVKLTLIYPATEKHVKKYKQQNSFMVQETGTAYATKIKPYAETQALSLQWVDNILEGKAEVERVIYNDADPETGFLLLPDLKWSQEKTEDLYVLAIVRKKGILSLRELNASHLPLLESVYEKAKMAINHKYDVPLNQIRAYIHYHPTYYHFHVHFTLVSYQAPGSLIGQSHLLEDVINNIKNVDSHYYANRTMTFQVREDSPLLALLNTC